MVAGSRRGGPRGAIVIIIESNEYAYNYTSGGERAKLAGRQIPVTGIAAPESLVPGAPDEAPRQRRSILAQDRSRRTRDALMDAATALWNERGSQAGYDATTIEDIVRAAGVTKGTFYFHFASKIDILLQINAATEASMAQEAIHAMEAGNVLDVALQRAAVVLADESQQRPRAAFALILREYHRDPALMRERSSFRQLLPKLFEEARTRGELPPCVDAEQIAALAAAVIYSACEAWADGRSPGLLDDLQYGLRVLLAGVRAEASGLSL
jgi:AcrR family transcriptional regulator